MRAKTPDLIGASLLIALGAAFAIGATGYGIFGEGGRIGPGFMPFATGLLMAVFGAMVGAEVLLRAPRGQEAESTEEVESADEAESGARRIVALVFGLTLVGILLIPVFGFLLSFGLLVFALVWYVEREGLLLGLGLGAGAALFAWLVFGMFLQIPLPGGVLGIGG